MKRPSRQRHAGPAPQQRTVQTPLWREILAQTRSGNFKRYVQDLLIELCRIDTTPKPDPGLMQTAEERCFRIIERELNRFNFFGASIERRPIDPAIQNHSNYSLLHFTKTPRRPLGLSAEETYAGRGNLLYSVSAKRRKRAGQSIALNAHIDVVAPYFPPHSRGSKVFGRGACDDKGPVVSIIAALKVLSAAMAKAGLEWNRPVTAMFVVEEETGGNGSLSLALDRELKKQYESVLVCECTGLKFYAANRGAVWYRAELMPLKEVSPLEAFAFINHEMEKEGAALRVESRHPLFPQRPVQTCHGILGPFGEHPSRICGELSFTIKFARRPTDSAKALVADCLEAGLARYIGLYGDKTKVKDPATGKPLVLRHYDLRTQKRDILVDVYGATGHMGAIRERDGAITKMAYMVRNLFFSRARLEREANGSVTLELAKGTGNGPSSPLIFEGGQGFVPTHTVTEVMRRLRQAAERGAECYLRQVGRPERGPDVVRITYEKLHNDAFTGNPNSKSVKNAIAAAKTCGLWRNEPILGWTVSCDARLFASEYPGMDVLTFGPGQLTYAHSDQEQIELEEIRAATEFLALFLLRQTGTYES